MARTLAILSAVVLLAAAADAASTVTLSSIQPPKLNVNLSFVIDGVSVTPSSPCQSQAPGSACLPVPHAVRDQVIVNYAVKADYPANTTDTVQLKACYSPFSSVNRPWRAANNIIAKSKTCPFVIASGLNPSSGNATWKIPQNVPIATYFVRAYVLAPNPADSSSPNPVAFGNSVGYFQVQPISTKEKGLLVAAGICICVGPILFVSFMLWEFKFSKKRV